MMSEDDDPYVTDYEEPTMEIVVETLTGTTFEINVAPNDTIGSIKSKIQRVEGIPVSHQHLLHRLSELRNEDRLCDHNITAGSTLRLVLSLRGGPISTRRFTTTEHLAWKELKDYVDTTRDDIINKLPSGSKVTVLLFRDGDNLNLVRVVENEDGTCYPYTDQWPPPSRSGQFENVPVNTADRLNENSVLMRKVVELRCKMERLSIQKKAKKPKAETSNTTRTSYESGENSNLEDLRPRKSLNDMYSDRLLLLEQRRNIGRSHRPRRLDPSTLPIADDLPIPSTSSSSSSRSCTPLQPPNITILEEETETTLNKQDTDFTPTSPISVTSEDSNSVTVSQIHVPTPIPHVMLQNRNEPTKTSESEAHEFCNVLFNEQTNLPRILNCGRRRIERLKNNVDISYMTNGTSSHYGRRSLDLVRLPSVPVETRPFKLPRMRNQDQSVISESSSSATLSNIQNLPSLVTKKTRTRCLFCNKRLNITTVHTCRCGGVFCAPHRYAEVHQCHYDYKTSGRKLIEHANPLVAAPKLPKI